MKVLHKIKRSRLKLAVFGCIFLGVCGIRAMETDKEGVATACFSGVLTIITIYIGGDSYRKSDPIETEENFTEPT